MCVLSLTFLRWRSQPLNIKAAAPTFPTAWTVCGLVRTCAVEGGLGGVPPRTALMRNFSGRHASCGPFFCRNSAKFAGSSVCTAPRTPTNVYRRLHQLWSVTTGLQPLPCPRAAARRYGREPRTIPAECSLTHVHARQSSRAHLLLALAGRRLRGQATRG